MTSLLTQPGPWRTRLIHTEAPGEVILVRLYVGAVFASEGVLKFVRPDELGAGRFDRAGIPLPGFFASLDGILEIACGLLILAGLFTRLAAVPMLVNMAGALAITKLPILWGAAPLFPGASGWWDLAHASRTDLAQLCGALFLLAVGAGAWSADAHLSRHTRLEAATRP
ncbi:DoxX family protein [Streptomyces sp. TRM64462]|uniref:DoxX family protein n=1 Tax=Streptomyces sp. TRM64462 TaxID=2741726 RepID=UPI001585D67C|nr:DoxX family protein [Streptomyces sp. TRM64462]